MKYLSFFFCLVGIVTRAEASPCALSPDQPPLGVTSWYGLYYEDTKIGHATTSSDQVIEGSERLISLRFDLTFKLEQTEESIAQVRNYEAAPPHRLVNGSYQTADRLIEYVARGDDLHLSENGSERVWSGVKRMLCDEEDIVLFQFLREAPGIGDQVTTTDFDVEHQTLVDSTHHVETVSTRKILGADHVFHDVISTADSDVLSYKARSQYRNGEAVNAFLGPLELRVETEAVAREPNKGIDLFAEFEKPLNQPLTDLWEIEHLTLKVRLDDPTLAIDEVIRDRYLQRVDYVDEQTAVIRLGDYDAPLGDDNLNDFLKPTSMHPSDHPRVKTLAEEIQAGVSDPEDETELARALLNFVASYIENVPESPYDYNTTSLFDILDNRTGDCTEHSQLFITLARALGLPARDATGYVYNGDDTTPRLSGHAWVEAFIDGRWIGLDPSWEEFDLNRSHVQFDNDFILGMSFEILDIDYR